MIIKNSKIIIQDLRKVYSTHLFIEPDEDSSRKEHYKPVVLMNTDPEILNKKLGNQTQQHEM